MTKTVPANGAALRQRLLDLGISERRFGALTGLGPSTLRSLTSGRGISASVTLGTLQRVLAETGLTAREFLEPPQAEDREADRDETTAGDVAVLAQVLVQDLRMHPKQRLARALHWDLTRLDAAIGELHRALTAAGLAVHVNGMGVTVRPADNRAEQAARRLAACRDVEEDMDNGAVRLLYTAITTGLTRTATRKGDQPAVAYLHRHGFLTMAASGDGQRLRLHDDVTYALDVP